MSIKVNGKKFPSPKCPKCGNPTFLRGSVQILSNESKYIFYCPDCEIYAPQANTAEKAAKNFEELAKQYKPLEILCGKCEHYKPIEKRTGHCTRRNLPAHETGTCTEGKKKDNGQTTLDLLNDGKGGAIAIGKLAQPLEASTDLNEISAAGIYSVDTSNTHDCTAIYYKDPETIIKVIEYMRAQGYIVEATAKGIIIQGKAAGG